MILDSKRGRNLSSRSPAIQRSLPCPEMHFFNFAMKAKGGVILINVELDYPTSILNHFLRFYEFLHQFDLFISDKID